MDCQPARSDREAQQSARVIDIGSRRLGLARSIAGFEGYILAVKDECNLARAIKTGRHEEVFSATRQQAALREMITKPAM